MLSMDFWWTPGTFSSVYTLTLARLDGGKQQWEKGKFEDLPTVATCNGLDENGPIGSFLYLTACSAVGKTIWKGGVALLEEVTGVWGHLRFKNPMPLPVSLPGPIVLVVSTCELSAAVSVRLPATTLSGAVRYPPEKTAQTQVSSSRKF